MSKIEYQNVTDLPILDEATENTHVIVEDNGSFKRMSGDKLGGSGGGVKTAIIRSSEYLNTMAGLSTAVGIAISYECVNMTFEEAWHTMTQGEPLAAVVQVANNASGACILALGVSADSFTYIVPCIVIMAMVGSTMNTLYWTADGVSIDEPSSGK